MIGTDCIGNFKSNNHAVTATTAPSDLNIYTNIKSSIEQD
jgi:hypothetical protein